jgi:hypothetical protein
MEIRRTEYLSKVYTGESYPGTPDVKHGTTCIYVGYNPIIKEYCYRHLDLDTVFSIPNFPGLTAKIALIRLV